MGCVPGDQAFYNQPCGHVRLIVETKPEPEVGAGRMAALLRATQTRLGFLYIASMEEYLLGRGVSIGASSRNYELPNYHLIITPIAQVFRVIGGLFREFGSLTLAGRVENVEPDFVLGLHALSTKIGTNFSLTSGLSKHSQYLGDLNVTAASGHSVDGGGVRIAIIDTGLEASRVVNRYIDLTTTTTAGPASKADAHGHGTAMTDIIQSIAPRSDICSIRVTSSGQMFVWDLLASVISAVFSFNAHILNMSLGCKYLNQACGICGGQSGARSTVCEKFFSLIGMLAKVGGPDPIFVASTGNDGISSDFEWPANFNNVLAIGSVTHSKSLSSFSNSINSKPLNTYGLCPGGEMDAQGNITEYVGEGDDGGTKTFCAGTSPAAAYASGILGLLRNYHDKYSLAVDSATLLDKINTKARADVQLYNKNDHGMGRIIYDP